MSEETTRKEFLQTVGLTAGAAAAAAIGFSRPARAENGGETIAQLARFGVQDGKVEEAKALLTTLVKAVEENEPGVLTYIAHISEKTGDVVFYEVYENAAALTAHGQMPHMNEMRTQFATAFKPPLDLERLTPVAGVDRVASGE